MKRYTRRIYVRATDADLAHAKTLAEGTGPSVSDLARLLPQLPAGDAAAQPAVVLDLATANRLYRELNHWDYQRNQAAHALNRIAYYLRRNDMDAATCSTRWRKRKMPSTPSAARPARLPPACAPSQSRGSSSSRDSSADPETHIRPHLLRRSIQVPHQEQQGARVRLHQHQRTAGGRIQLGLFVGKECGEFRQQKSLPKEAVAFARGG